MDTFEKIVLLPKQDGSGTNFFWEGGEAIHVTLDAETNEVVIKANTVGLTTLARHLLTLAEKAIENREHLHLDPACGVVEDSLPLILEKDNDLK